MTSAVADKPRCSPDRRSMRNQKHAQTTASRTHAKLRTNSIVCRDFTLTSETVRSIAKERTAMNGNCRDPEEQGSKVRLSGPIRFQLDANCF